MINKRNVNRGDSILLIEDAPVVRFMVEKMLAKAGYEVLSASDGETGIDLYRRNQSEVSCVIMDLILPDINGNTVIDFIKADNPELPIIMSSGYSLDSLIDRMGIDDYDYFLEKPYSYLQLMDVLSKVIGGSSKPLETLQT